MVRPLRVEAPALAPNVGRLRHAVRDWLAAVLDDPDLTDDLAMAVSEALENAADHAFAGRPAAGTMTVLTELCDERGVVIRILDDGQWRTPAADGGFRGRGIAMMKALAETAVVEPGTVGTAVTLTQSLRARSMT